MSMKTHSHVLYGKSVLKCVVEVKPRPCQPSNWVNVTWFSTLRWTGLKNPQLFASVDGHPIPKSPDPGAPKHNGIKQP